MIYLLLGALWVSQFGNILSTANRHSSTASAKCSQRLFEAKGNPAPGSNGFSIEVNDAPPGLDELNVDGDDGLEGLKWNSSGIQPDGYIPGKHYVLTVRGWRTQFIVQTFRGFGLTALFEDTGKAAGHFDVKKNRKGRRGDARIAPNCRQAGVSHTHLRPKTEVRILWRAPETDAGGCILFRASVIQSRQVWYWLENEMTRKFCPAEGHQLAVPKDDPNAECCACDEAEYDTIFVGIWSRETHPKDYPTLEHLTHFTDMLGASHSKNYSFWRYGDTATDGVKEIAEWGNTYKGESEMRGNASEIRTILKMKGLWYPGPYFNCPQILRSAFCAQTTEPQKFCFNYSTDSAEKEVRRFCGNMHRICGNIHRFCKTSKNMQKPQNSISIIFLCTEKNPQICGFFSRFCAFLFQLFLWSAENTQNSLKNPP